MAGPPKTETNMPKLHRPDGDGSCGSSETTEKVSVRSLAKKFWNPSSTCKTSPTSAITPEQPKSIPAFRRSSADHRSASEPGSEDVAPAARGYEKNEHGVWVPKSARKIPRPPPSSASPSTSMDSTVMTATTAESSMSHPIVEEVVAIVSKKFEPFKKPVKPLKAETDIKVEPVKVEPVKLKPVKVKPVKVEPTKPVDPAAPKNPFGEIKLRSVAAPRPVPVAATPSDPDENDFVSGDVPCQVELQQQREHFPPIEIEYDLQDSDSDDEEDNEVIFFMMPRKYMKQVEDVFQIEEWTFDPGAARDENLLDQKKLEDQKKKPAEQKPAETDVPAAAATDIDTTKPTSAQQVPAQRQIERTSSHSKSSTNSSSRTRHKHEGSPTNKLNVTAKLPCSGVDTLESLDERTPQVSAVPEHDLSQDEPQEQKTPNQKKDKKATKSKKKSKKDGDNDDISVTSRLSNSDVSAVSARLEQRSKARKERREAEQTNEANQAAKNVRDKAREEAKKLKELQDQKDKQLQDQLDQKKAAREAKMLAIRDRIAKEKEQERLANEVKEKKEKAKKDQIDNSDLARRERAHQWYVRCGMVSREELIKRIEKLGSATEVTKEDIHLLPWDPNGRVVNAARMMRLKLGG